jgi:hypothetical protein
MHAADKRARLEVAGTVTVLRVSTAHTTLPSHPHAPLPAAQLEGIPAGILAAAGVLPQEQPSTSDVTAVMSVGGPLLPTQASGIPRREETTPELEAVASLCNPDDEATAAPQLAAIFRPRAERKVSCGLYCAGVV